MRSDLTDVTVVLDRSGSMASCRQEAENGVNHFVDDQKKQEGDCVFSLVQFDNEYEFVHRAVAIGDVPKFSLVPRGMTALLDAVGRAINETGERLSKTPEDDRPGLVVFVILTDGLENASHEFTKQQIKDMIQRQRDEHQWQFTFLGANQDAFAEAAGLGIAKDAAACFATKSSEEALTCGSANVTRMRKATRYGQQVNCAYSNDERSAMRGG